MALIGLIYEENVAIPMRDGTLLRANLWRPDRAGRFPVILERTPYNKGAGADSPAAARFVHAGFAYAIQDSRGRYASDGTWVPFSRPDTGEAEDGFDTVAWLARQPWCDGRIGTNGASYVGWMQWQLAPLRPPGLLAMSARTIPPELSDIDWNGGFKLVRRLHWWLISMAPDLRRRHQLPPPHTPREASQAYETEWPDLVRRLPVSRFPEALPPGLAESALAWLKNPAARTSGTESRYKDVTVPNFDITGWFDHCSDTLKTFSGLRRNGATEEARKLTRILIGPWNHMLPGRRKQGSFDFGPAAEVDIQGLLLRWFDRRLRGADNGVDDEPPVRYFVMGSNTWASASDWPPPGAREQTLYLRDGLSLAADAPVAGEKPDVYDCDPANPVPSLGSPDNFTLASDRRLLEQRADILRYVTPPLEQELEIAGHPEVVLHAASTARDTDFFARLVDETPGGPALEIGYGMTRARYRAGFDAERPLTPGEPVEIRIRLGPTACRFMKGHRIRLEITGSDFPIHDRNHQTGGNDLFETELKTARQTVFHDNARASRLILPVTTAAPAAISTHSRPPTRS